MARHPIRKSKRKRLAKAELLLLLSAEAEEWAKQCGSRSSRYLPFDEWGKNGGEEDHLRRLARVYELTGADLDGLLMRIADELENRAERAGWGDRWDAPWAEMAG